MGASCCSVHQRVAFCQGAYLAQEIVSLFLLPCCPWSQRKAMLLMYFPMLIRCSVRTREGLRSFFRECGGCHPSLQIAIPYVPSTVTRSFHALLPRFPSAGCLTSTSWQRWSPARVSSPSYGVSSRSCQHPHAGRGRVRRFPWQEGVGPLQGGECHPRE